MEKAVTKGPPFLAQGIRGAFFLFLFSSKGEKDRYGRPQLFIAPDY
jgi:hypothetical protein